MALTVGREKNKSLHLTLFVGIGWDAYWSTCRATAFWTHNVNPLPCCADQNEASQRSHTWSASVQLSTAALSCGYSTTHKSTRCLPNSTAIVGVMTKSTMVRFWMDVVSFVRCNTAEELEPEGGCKLSDKEVGRGTELCTERVHGTSARDNTARNRDIMFVCSVFENDSRTRAPRTAKRKVAPTTPFVGATTGNQIQSPMSASINVRRLCLNYRPAMLVIIYSHNNVLRSHEIDLAPFLFANSKPNTICIWTVWMNRNWNDWCVKSETMLVLDLFLIWCWQFIGIAICICVVCLFFFSLDLCFVHHILIFKCFIRVLVLIWTCHCNRFISGRFEQSFRSRIGTAQTANVREIRRKLCQTRRRQLCVRLKLNSKFIFLDDYASDCGGLIERFQIWQTRWVWCCQRRAQRLGLKIATFSSVFQSEIWEKFSISFI